MSKVGKSIVRKKYMRNRQKHFLFFEVTDAAANVWSSSDKKSQQVYFFHQFSGPWWLGDLLVAAEMASSFFSKVWK